MNQAESQFPLKEPFKVFWDVLQEKKTDVMTALQLMEKGVIADDSLRVVAIRLDKGDFKSVEQIEALIKDGDASVPGYHWQVTEDSRGYSVILKKD